MNQSSRAVLFLVRTMGTWNFWLLFLATLTGVLMVAWRGTIREDIFKVAQKTVGRKGSW